MLPLVSFLLSASLYRVLNGHRAPSDVVTTGYGKLQGFTTTTDAGFQADVFLGVPFAQPPVGDLRFEKPRNPLPWDGIRQATEPADGCISLFNFTFSGYDMSENCLYLNIIAPHNKTGQYPVLFIVHGSGFTMGSAHMYRDYDDIASSFVSRGIVVVIIQYRLAVYGFVALGSEDLHGNLGLWDQIAALQLVKANIAPFGGDPDQITVFGVSAGSSSVSALSISPHSRDLFSQAIQMAGSSLSEWSMSDYTLTATQTLLKALRCASDSTTNAKRCLKEATAEEMAAAVGNILPEIFRLHANFVAFGPRIDGDLFPRPLHELIEEAPVKPTYIGMSEEESLVFTVMVPPFAPEFFQLYVPLAKQASFGYDDLVGFVRTAVVTKEAFGDNADEVVEKIVAFYLRRDASEDTNNVFYLRRYAQLCSDIQFNVPILREATMKAELGWPVFRYVQRYYVKNAFHQNLPFEAASHGSEHQFIFRGENSFMQANFSIADERVSQFLIDSLVLFIKSGNPSTNDVRWPQATREHPLRHLQVQPRPVMDDELFGDRLRFWNDLTHEYRFGIVEGIPVRNRQAYDEL